jgi:hypothetical protein
VIVAPLDVIRGRLRLSSLKIFPTSLIRPAYFFVEPRSFEPEP